MKNIKKHYIHVDIHNIVKHVWFVMIKQRSLYCRVFQNMFSAHMFISLLCKRENTVKCMHCKKQKILNKRVSIE